MRALQYLAACLCALGLALLLTPAARAEGDSSAAPVVGDPDFLCPAAEQLARPGMCPRYGPGGYVEGMHAYELLLELPPLRVEPLAVTGPVFHRYAQAIPDTPVYRHPAAAAAGYPRARLLGIGQGVGFIFVSLEGLVKYEGEDWYRINRNEYVRRSDLSLIEPSGFRGVVVASQPERPFAWMVRNFQPRLTAGGEINPTAATLYRYQMVQIFAAQEVDGWNWYQVGPDQWVEQRNVGIVSPKPPPGGVTGRWIEVDLYEQTLAAYEGERMVYATLVSSGQRRWSTRPGLFHIWAKLREDRMSGAYAADRRDYYDLESVPWTMYFDHDIALHGAYWHNGFGSRKSHGCVNLAPRDAKWLYEWAAEGTWVWVHDSNGQTPTDLAPGSGA